MSSFQHQPLEIKMMELNMLGDLDFHDAVRANQDVYEYVTSNEKLSKRYIEIQLKILLK